MDLSGIAAVLMGLAAVGTTVWTIKNGRKGERKEEEQVVAAAKLAERVQGYDELAGYADRIEKRLEEALKRLDAQADKHAAEMERLHQGYDRRQDEQAERCRQQLRVALDNVHTLQQIVRDEIAQASALVVEDSAARHIETDHPEAPEDR